MYAIRRNKLCFYAFLITNNAKICSLWGTGLDVAVHRDFWGFQEQVTLVILHLRVVADPDALGGSWLFSLNIHLTFIFLCSCENYNLYSKECIFKMIFIERKENIGHGIPIKVNWQKKFMIQIYTCIHWSYVWSFATQILSTQ